MRNKLRHIRQSLSLKLSISILLMTVLIFLVSLGLLFIRSRRHIKQEAMEHAASVLNTTVQRVQRYLGTVEVATQSNDWLVTENLQPDDILSYSRRIVQLNANVNGCSITMEPDMFPQYGRYFSAYSVREGDSITTVREAEYEYFDKVWYKTPRELGKACWVDPFDDFNEGTLSAEGMIASYCKPLYVDGKFVGVISTDLSLDMLADVIAEEKPYPNAYFLLLGADGHYYVHPDSTRLVSQTIFDVANARSHPDIIALGHEMTTGHQGMMKVRVYEEPCQVSYCPVDGTDWSLALVCPDSDILRSYNQLTYIILALIAVGLVLILWFCRKIVTHAIRPLNRLVDQSQRMAEGHYDERIPRSSRVDAVGRLQNSFAAMQESLARHISQIQKVNEETARRNEELQQASLLVQEADRQKTVFIQNMTHQIRTPLNIIMGFAQVLRDSIKDLPVDEVRNITDTMSHNSMTLNRMVLMLYDSSDTGLSEEMNSRNYEEVSCNEVARESVANTNLHFPDLPVIFKTELPDSFCIRTSRLYLMRSLREILYNSAKYSDGQHITLHVSKTDTKVRFVFEDTGSGISEEYYEQIFVPFTKVDDLSEGLGLGLPLTKRHIQNLGGSLTLDTSYHDGCRFVVELPL
ncbi:MAG: HAMP domain-containing protein [Prevotella sp.]|nr:HAMP domain-containing protein [Prevotella sp.]